MCPPVASAVLIESDQLTPDMAGELTPDMAGLRPTLALCRRSGDYATALASGESEPLKPPPAPSSWDTRLAEAMGASGRAVMEERLIPDLLSDLAR